ncbi:MAG: hypothetical protein K2G76_02590 [Prevotella sp.]|nr:hypothetical protein [Prevotella sp.]
MALYADAVGTMHGRGRHHARTRSASCTDTLGIMHGHARHHVRTRSASCTDMVGTMCRRPIA